MTKKCKYPLVLGSVMVTALVMAVAALAWHVQDVVVTTACTDNTYVVSAAITQSQQYPGATIKSITPASFPGNTTGTKSVVVVVKWPNSNDTQTLTKSVTLAGTCVPAPADPQCPEGYTSAGKSEGVLLCTKETVRTVEVPGPTVTVTRDVPGPTVYVDKIIETKVDVPGPTVTVTKVQWKTKLVNHTKVRVKVVHRTVIKKVKVIGLCKYNGHIAAPGSG